MGFRYCDTPYIPVVVLFKNRPFLNYLSELTSAERFRDSIILATAWLLESSAPIRPAVPSFALTGIEGWTKLIV
ncbi:hypothetical protein DTO217A2_3798 [Paecilomyces variotii]|nr:hypothetical protein DTO217A2_3798 [Paecilomyces variotii]